MIKNLIYGTMLGAAVLFASCSGNQNNSGNNADNKTTETNTPAQKGTIEDVWRSYLTSEYLDIPAKNVEKAMSSLDKKGSNAAQVIFDDSTNEVLSATEPDPNATDEEAESDDSALGYYYETLALFDNKDGGQTVLLYSSRPGWGRNLVSIFSYSNGTLKRLPVSKLPFSDDMFNNEPNYDFEQGKISNVWGTEVQYLDPSLNIDPASFTKDGFDTESAGEHDRTFKWDGEKFTSIAG
ncbi:MAG: hypothetical protein J6Y24_04690 [Bacteroidales bacterium]|nr:hypothetical protein [Bacteroidales bacterium]